MQMFIEKDGIDILKVACFKGLNACATFCK